MGLLLSGFTAFAISYGTAWCLRVTSATTYSMLGALNKLPVAFFGAILFADGSGTWVTYVSVAVGLAAGILYADGRNRQVKEQERLRRTSVAHRRKSSLASLSGMEQSVEGRSSGEITTKNGGSWIPLEEVRSKSGQIVSEIRRL